MITFRRWYPTSILLCLLPAGCADMPGTPLASFEGSGDFLIPNEEVTIAAKLDLPEGSGPFPAMLVVMGAGRKTRIMEQNLAEFFVNRGIAVLRYDKRGVGDTTGSWFDVYSSQTSLQMADEWFGQLAGDAAKLVEFLSNHQSIRAGRIAVFGISEGGNIAPLIAALTDHLRLIVSNVGPTHRVGTYDPEPLIRALSIPVLWQYGERDPIVPPGNSVPLLEQVIEETRPDFTIKVYANSTHSLFDELRRVKSPFMQDAFDWMVAKGFMEDTQ